MPKYITTICQNCGKEHQNRYSQYLKHKNHFCSPACGYTFRKSNIKERIERNIFYSPDGCHYWIGANNGLKNRPIINMDGKVSHATRVIYKIYKGPIANGLLVCHTCDNGLCVNPDHFFLGTYKDNTQDMLKKGRGNHAFGERSGMSKVTDAQVIEMRALRGVVTGAEIAKMFNITSANVSSILKGQTWKHLL